MGSSSLFPLRAGPTTPGSRPPAAPQIERPRLELSGRKLALAFESLVGGSEEHGGIERYVAALEAKSALFREALGGGRAREIAPAAFGTLVAMIAPARRRAAAHLAGSAFERLRERVVQLLETIEDTASTDRRLAEFCAGFPDDRGHRWVRDLAAELLHNVDPERYPLMCRWVWDARIRTGALREMWHGPDAEAALERVPDGYGTFLVLREELAGFLTANGVYRDVIHYADLLTAQVYAGYILEQAAGYLRVDFTAPADPLEHTRRLLGLDVLHPRGGARLKTSGADAPAAEGTPRTG
ncbi:MAG TPA: hypothetical protein VNK67_12395 [Burkholderiales bacterium]|nr:hypothetical protein [Burkholderiales bacterium]